MKPYNRILICCLCLVCLSGGVMAAGGETVCDTPYCFSQEDFSREAGGIFVTEVPDPETGILCLGQRRILPGDVLPRDSWDKLTLIPAGTEACRAVVSYLPILQEGVGGAETFTLRIGSGKNEAPRAADSSIETYKNIPNDGMLRAVDPENGSLTFILGEKPSRGEVQLKADGYYIYTPNKNKVGEDAFTFTVKDEAGNESQPATVTVRILKPTQALTFGDMEGSPDAFEAMWLREQGLGGGRQVGDVLCYHPGETLSRGEFLVMLMKLRQLEVSPALTVSGFSDWNQAPGWMQPYLAGAMRWGVAAGELSGNRLVFRPGDPITRQEAAVMVQNVLNLPVEAAAVESEAAPWARDSVLALSQAGLSLPHPEGYLTRREAAKLLYGVSRLEELPQK